MAGSSVQSLQEENRQLQNALKEALQEKYEAAQYGLRLLEEKQQLQNQIEELEKRSEEVNRELKLSKQVKLHEQNEIQRRLSLAGFEEEQDMLSKYANKEQQLIAQVQDLEVELKDVKVKLDRQMADNDGLHQKYADQMAKCEELGQVNQRLKIELKETKVKEGQLLNEFDDLEAENLDLQKTILALKTSQVEFESLRHEFKRLQEDNEIIHSQLEEITRLKRMTEKSLEEALESLQIERDQRHNLRKELDSRLTSESMYHFTALRHDLKGSVNLSLTNRDGAENSSQVLEKIDAALMEKLGSDNKYVQEDARLSQSNAVVKNSNGEQALSTPDDLFTELRVTEMTKYQTELSRLEADKNELNRLLEETQRSLELANSEVSNKQERINGLLAQLDAIMSIRSEADEEFERKEAESEPSASDLAVPGGHNAKDIMAESTLSVLLQLDENDENENSIRNQATYKRLRKALRLTENRYSVALRQITSMQHDLWRYHEREKLNSRPELATEEGLKQELIRLQQDLEQRSEEIKNLKNHLSSNQESSRSTDDRLRAFSKDISRALNIHLDSYALVCSAMKENPAKQVTELAERLQIPLRLNNKESPDVSVASDVNTDDEGDRLVMRLAPADSPSSEALGNAVDFQLSMANHLRHLLYSFSEKYTQVMKKVRLFRSSDVFDLACGSTGQVSMDLEEAQQEIRALKASNEVKREQVATMRSMLRTNKTTAETALANLKQKYEKEKLLVTGTMQSLRDELAVLKEDSAKNASLRAMYSQRYEEFAAQIDEMQQKLIFAENERRTLNSLLRLAILQKLDLTQRLEDIAVKQEESGYFQKQQQSHSMAPRVSLPASYGIPQAQHPALSCANSLLPNPVNPQPYILGNHPVGAPPFSPPEPSGLGRVSGVASGGASGVHQTPGLPLHRTILSPQHASPNSHTGAKFISPGGTDRSKRTPRTKRDGQS
ncbi:BICD2 [Fasciola gigantica]|uniref:BICD2 n=1 Tax=Fasciola gigantica TaxID=46835 RepID=A0A504Y638_FASGI|nr:BICD2 [Fasciola gigantica]